MIWFRSANSHTGPQLHRCIRGRTDGSNRLRAVLLQKSLASRGASTDEYAPFCNVYQPQLDLTADAWLSGRFSLSDVIRLRSFSPLRQAWHRGRFALAFCQSTSVPDVAAAHCTRGPTDRDRSATRRSNDTLFCGTRHDRIR